MKFSFIHRSSIGREKRPVACDRSWMDNAPFLGSDAVRNGLLTRADLRRDYLKIYRDVYMRRPCEIDAATRACAASVFARGKAVVAGPSAAALHGSKWIPAEHKAELIWHEHRQPYAAILIRADELLTGEVETIDGVAVTTAARTAYDLGRKGTFTNALAMVDSLCNATSLRPGTVALLADNHRGSRGIVQLRQVLEIADGGSESPQESRLRLLIHDVGLPLPETQIKVEGANGRVFARIDMGWKRWKVAVEYDGEQHWSNPEQRAWDIERTYRLEQLGWKVIRVSAEQLRRGRIALVARIRDALRASGAPV